MQPLYILKVPNRRLSRAATAEELHMKTEY